MYEKGLCFYKKNNLNKDEIVMIGDQLLTDIVCANKIGVTNILVKSISRKTERWYTRINRLREEKVLKKIERIDGKKALEIRNIIGKSSDYSE
ncbi:MAG: HAD hydrolase-like protein [Christensenellales bacterium]